MDLDRYRAFIPEWPRFVEASERPEPTVFRTRTGRVDPDELREALAHKGFSLSPLEGLPGFFQVDEEPYPVTFTLEHWLGLLYVQQASTGVAAPALDPRPGERVLDLCSAPGGKTTHLADLMEDRGCLVASDVSESRMRGLLGNVYKLGHPNVLVVAGDGREFPDGALFDRVLVDAPCSGEGTLRRRSGQPPEQSASFMGYVTRAQEDLLRKAVRLTRPGGKVLYVTCTFSPEENEAVVDRVLADEPVELEPLELPVPHARGLTSFEGERFDPRLEGAARVYPHHFDSGGLFLARLRRLDGGASGQGVPAPAGGGGPEAGWSPVPPVFPGDDLAAEEAEAMWEKAVTDLRERYDVDSGALEGLDWTIRGGRIWLNRCGEWPLDAWAEGGWRPIALGFRALEFDTQGRPRPTNGLLQWLGPSIRAGVVDVDTEALRTLLAREPLPAPEDLRGPVALRYRGRVVGRGMATRRGLLTEIPKARARDLGRVLEREWGGDAQEGAPA